MAILSDNVLLDVVVVVLLICLAAVLCWEWLRVPQPTFWRDRQVPFLPPPSHPLLGLASRARQARTPIALVLKQMYDELSGNRYGGYYVRNTPVMMVRDPGLIQQMLVKDFQHFHDRGYPMDESKDPLSGHLFNLAGARWRSLRAKLTPTFTSHKMKTMFHLMSECSRQLQQCLENHVECSAEVEMKEMSSKYTTDIIGTCAFGLKLNSLVDPNSEFRIMGRKLFEAPSFWSSVKSWINVWLPSPVKFPIESASSESKEFFRRVVQETVEFREESNVNRDDFMDLLIKLKNKCTVEDATETSESSRSSGIEDHFEFTDNMLAAQAFVFFLAGFDTSSTTMSFCLLELALNPDIQERVREEILSVLRANQGELSYESVQQMTHLDRAVSETLRKYPPLPNLARMCTKPYTIPGSSVELAVGSRVVIPVYALHHDPKFFPDPHLFDPDRFTDENKKSRPQGAYLPFGTGPRMCIGSRFGLLQTKIGLSSILSSFEITVSNKALFPVKLESRGAMTNMKGGTWVGVKKKTFTERRD